MSQTQIMIAAIAGVFLAGFLLVGSNKQQTTEQKEAASMIRALSAMQTMANKKCPALIKEKTGSQVFFPSKTDSDKATYVTLEWIGEKGDNFKTASCTLHINLGGVSKLVIDGKTIIDKKV